MGYVERRETKAHDVRLAKIADHAACGQCLHCAKAILIAVRNLTAAQIGILRRYQFEAAAITILRNQRYKQIAQCHGFHPERIHSRLNYNIEATLQQGEGNDRRRAGEHAANAGRRTEISGKFERCGMAHPAADRLADRLMMALWHKHIGGRAGATIEILITAANGKVRAGTR